jgi:hypothetical protein
MARHRLCGWCLARHSIGLGLVESPSGTTTADPNAGANGAGTGGGLATHLRSAFFALSGVWARRAGGGRTAESRFIAVVGSASPILSSPSPGVRSKGGGDRLATANGSPSQSERARIKTRRARHLECAHFKANMEVLWPVKHPYRSHRPLLRR